MTALTGMIVAILGYITVFFSTKMNDIKKDSRSTRENSEQYRDTTNLLSEKMDVLADSIGSLEARLEKVEHHTNPDMTHTPKHADDTPYVADGIDPDMPHIPEHGDDTPYVGDDA